jgi:hypothetical protein
MKSPLVEGRRLKESLKVAGDKAFVPLETPFKQALSDTVGKIGQNFTKAVNDSLKTTKVQKQQSGSGLNVIDSKKIMAAMMKSKPGKN